MFRSITLLSILVLLVCANCTPAQPDPTSTPTVTPSVTPSNTPVFNIITQTPAPAAFTSLPVPITETIPPVTLPVQPSATPTPCVPRSDWEGAYTIQAGDTLFGIAQQFNVTLAQLQTGNCIQNANLVFSGQTLRVPGE